MVSILALLAVPLVFLFKKTPTRRSGRSASSTH
jgi:hypothetical protein